MPLWKESNLITHRYVLGSASPDWLGHSTHLTFDDSKTIPKSAVFCQTGSQAEPNPSLPQIKRGSPYWPQEQKGWIMGDCLRNWWHRIMVRKMNEKNNFWRTVYLWGLIQSRRGTCNIKWTQKCEVLLRDNTHPSCPGPNKSTTSDLFWSLESGELSRLVPPTSDLQTCWLY